MFIAYISILSALIPIVLGLIQWRKLVLELKLIVWIGITSFLIDVVCLILGRYSINNYPLINLLCPVQLALFMYVFSMFFEEKLSFKIVFACFLVFFVINFIWIENPFEFNTNSNGISSLILIAITIRYLYKLLSELPEIHIYKLPMLWIAFGVLLYCSGTLFVFLASKYLIKSPADHQSVWIITLLLNISQFIFFGVGLWQNYKAVRSSV